ncbi:TetR-like C-terminal domain-containing protein, partial [Oenococcus oeni]|uniref:TetR-like C-terminal domain-containing protein n=2 Tax=Oenococcus oeni TaxID=1247 RepID=UPI0008F8B04A
MSPHELKQFKLRAIYRGLLTLLQNKHLSDITVSDLCRTAAVSQTYYYRNFSSFQEIVSRYQEQMIMSYLNLALNNRHIDFTQLMTAYFQIMGDHATETLLLIHAGLFDVLISAFRKVYVFLAQNSYIDSSRTVRGKNQYFANFMAGAVISTEVQWMKQGMEESPREIGIILKQLFRFS